MNRFTFVPLTLVSIVFSAALAGCSDRDAENKSASPEAMQQTSEAAAPAHIDSSTDDPRKSDDGPMGHDDQGHGQETGGHGDNAAHEQGEHTSMQGGSHWDAPAEAASLINPVTADAASVRRGRDLFANNCISCHGNSGRGDGPVSAALTPKPADLVTMAPMHPAGAFFWKIKNGRGPMPAWENSLRENQMWDLVNYIKSLGEAETSVVNENDGHNHAH